MDLETICLTLIDFECSNITLNRASWALYVCDFKKKITQHIDILTGLLKRSALSTLIFQPTHFITGVQNYPSHLAGAGVKLTQECHGEWRKGKTMG